MKLSRFVLMGCTLVIIAVGMESWGVTPPTQVQPETVMVGESSDLHEIRTVYMTTHSGSATGLFEGEMFDLDDKTRLSRHGDRMSVIMVTAVDTIVAYRNDGSEQTVVTLQDMTANEFMRMFLAPTPAVMFRGDPTPMCMGGETLCTCRATASETCSEIEITASKCCSSGDSCGCTVIRDPENDDCISLIKPICVPL